MSLPTKPNQSTDLPTRSLQVWPSSVGENTDLDPGDGTSLCARWITVGNPAGSLVVKTLTGTTTYTKNQILAKGQLLQGQFTQIVASGSASYELLIEW